MNLDTDFKEPVFSARRNTPERDTKKLRANAKEPEEKKLANLWVRNLTLPSNSENKKMLILNPSLLKIDTIIIKFHIQIILFI
jgi:hypothetical protein